MDLPFATSRLQTLQTILRNLAPIQMTSNCILIKEKTISSGRGVAAHTCRPAYSNWGITQHWLCFRNLCGEIKKTRLFFIVAHEIVHSSNRLFSDMLNHNVLLCIYLIKDIAEVMFILLSDCRFNIPKGTVVMSNIWHNHNDPSVWKEPETFRPERFLDEEGKYRPREEFTPFGIGKSRPRILLHQKQLWWITSLNWSIFDKIEATQSGNSTKGNI